MMGRFLLLLILSQYCYPLFGQEKTLDYFINAGISNSPLLKDFTNQKVMNLIDSLRINATYLPQVNGISTNSYAPTIKGWGYDGAITNGANVSALVGVSKLLVRRENLNNQHEAIRLLNESLTAVGQVTEQDIKKVITAQYITALGNFQQYQFNQKIVSLLRKEEVILKKLTEKAVYRQIDYLSFLVTIQQQELFITQIKNQYQNECATLNYFAGLQDTGFITLSVPEINVVLIPEIENTVFYKQFMIDSLKLKNTDAQINFSYQPKISLYADGGYLTSFAEKAYKNFGTSFGFSILWPIYDGKQKKMQHDKISIAEQTRQTYRDYFKTQYKQQIAQLAQQLQHTQELINQTATQLKYAETLIEANRKLLETGDAKMPDYILAINNYLTAKNIITQGIINKLQIINQLNYWNRN